MGTITTQAIVLRTTDYRDYDRIVTLFALGHGRLTAAARACRRIKSPLLNVAVPFVQGEFVLQERQGRLTIQSCQVEQDHYALRMDPVNLSYGAYLAALCEETVQEGQGADELFTQLLEALAHLSFGDAPPSAVCSWLMLQLLMGQGIGPVLDHCVQCGGTVESPRFPPWSNGVMCRHCAPALPMLPDGCIEWAIAAMEGGFISTQVDCGPLFWSLTRYIAAHYGKDFKALKMIEIMQKDLFPII